jgi:hypothetical protein
MAERSQPRQLAAERAGEGNDWMMVFAYALFVPAGVGLTSAFGSQLVASTLHVTIASWALFIVILTAAVLVAYLGITTSASVDLVLVAGEIAVIAALAIAFRAEFRDEFRLGRHLLIPAAASVVFLFPLWGVLSLVPTRWRTCCPSFLWAGS